MSSILPLHEGKRHLISEEYIDGLPEDTDLKILVAVLRGINTSDSSVVHIQKVLVRSDGSEINRKGGMIIPVRVISDLKSAIDKAYMVCIENGLLDE
jgi:hypothetical protein